MKPFETLTVCGCEYHFKLTTANAVKLEEQLGTDLLTGTEQLGKISTLAEYFYSAGVSLNDNINTKADIYQLFDDFITEGGTYDTLQELTLDILVTSGILTEETREAQKKMKAELTAKLRETLEKSAELSTPKLLNQE